MLRVIREILAYQPAHTGTDIAGALDYLAHITTKKCVVFLISDFQDEDYENPLRAVAKKHDVIAISLGDPREFELPNAGFITLQDAETGEWRSIDTGSAAVRKRFRQLGVARRELLRTQLIAAGIDQIDVSGGTDDYILDLVRFFRTRERRGGR